MSELYDVIIIGAGPAGLSAAIYAGRSRLSTLLIEKGQDGGQIALTDEIENYPGQMLEGETGNSLVSRMTQQVERFGVERVTAMIKEVELTGPIKVVRSGNQEYKGKNIIIATGAHSRPIGCKNEGTYIGQGVSYCATCDANFFQDLEVYVVGGGDAAVEEALYLTKFARKVTIIHRRDELRAVKSIQEKAFANEKIDFLWNTVVEELHGPGILAGMTVRNVQTDEVYEIEANKADGMFGMFGFLGYVPNSGLFQQEIDMTEEGYIVTDENMHTNIEGVYAVGDIRHKSLRQVVTAAADGAIAAIQVERSK